MPGPETLYLRNGLAELPRLLTALGTKRVHVLAARSRRFVDDVTHALASFAPSVFDGAQVHVPAEVVDAASRKLSDSGADTIVAIGGGSVIGLGKALRLRHEVKFVAIPATYAGSEQTTVYGITREGDKQTGRDARVRPDLVLYDVSLTQDMPITLTVQSLINALAHVVSVLAGGELEQREDALTGAATVLRAIEDLLLAPRDLSAREQALRGATACALAFERGKPGAQHQLAHLLGGALRIEHAPLHAVLLPHFIAHLREVSPAVVRELERAVDREDLDAYLYDLLVRAGAPVSLDALGAAEGSVREVLVQRKVSGAVVRDARGPAAEDVERIVRDAQHGLRPPGRGGRIDLGSEPYALHAGPKPENAERVVLVLHGRGGEPGTLVRRVREIIGNDETTAILGLRAEGGAERWYAVRYSESGAGSDPEVLAAIARVDRALERLPPTTILFGFSQGACLALEAAARIRRPLTAVIALSGARIGAPSEWPAPHQIAAKQDFAREHDADPENVVYSSGLTVLLGLAWGDKWIGLGDLDATRAWFNAAGALVLDVSGPGDRHEITLRQRMYARTVIVDASGRSSQEVMRRPQIAAHAFTSRALVTKAGATGWGNTLTSEALPRAVPSLQSSPRLPPYGLYAEQLNGTGFTAPRAENQRTWLYRVRPSAQRRVYTSLEHSTLVGGFSDAPEINLCGFAPVPDAEDERDFIDGLVTVCGAGSAASRRGYAFHVYSANRSMEHRAFYSADGDLVILPQTGALTIMTELGALSVEPGHVAIVPRGMVFSVLLHGPHARGYVAEAFGRHFRLPDRGPIGANGLADARHFRAPHAWYEDRLDPDFRIVAKLGGALHEARQDHSPFDVVGWHGNYVPFVYDLDAFSPVGNVRWDHGDPSVHTVLSAPLDEPGTHTLDLVVFPARWDPTTNTFRPPFFHRNPVAEINGIIRENAPPDSPFQPGCVFITPSLTPHGPSGRAVERIRKQTDAEANAPAKLGGASLWFQFESALSPVLTPWAREHMLPDWAATWGSHRSYFS